MIGFADNKTKRIKKDKKINFKINISFLKRWKKHKKNGIGLSLR